FCCHAFVVCFFFQAEDGIRDLYVTGVQTCALPISMDLAAAWRAAACVSRVAVPPPGDVAITEVGLAALTTALQAPVRASTVADRSEERRVGKECRARLMRDSYKIIGTD